MSAVRNGEFVIEPGVVVAVLTDPYGQRPLIVESVTKAYAADGSAGPEEHIVVCTWLQETTCRLPHKWAHRRGAFLMSSLHRIGGPAL